MDKSLSESHCRPLTSRRVAAATTSDTFIVAKEMLWLPEAWTVHCLCSWMFGWCSVRTSTIDIVVFPHIVSLPFDSVEDCTDDLRAKFFSLSSYASLSFLWVPLVNVRRFSFFIQHDLQHPLPWVILAPDRARGHRSISYSVFLVSVVHRHLPPGFSRLILDLRVAVPPEPGIAHHVRDAVVFVLFFVIPNPPKINPN